VIRARRIGPTKWPLKRIEPGPSALRSFGNRADFRLVRSAYISKKNARLRSDWRFRARRSPMRFSSARASNVRPDDAFSPPSSGYPPASKSIDVRTRPDEIAACLCGDVAEAIARALAGGGNACGTSPMSAAVLVLILRGLSELSATNAP